MGQRKELTQGFIQDLLMCDDRIKFGFITENYKTDVHEVRILMQDDFTIHLDIDMFDFDEQQVIKELREMIEQVYGGSD